MIRFEFPADRKDIALAIGKALTEIGQGAAATVEDFKGQVEAEAAVTQALAEEQCDYTDALVAAGVEPSSGVVFYFKRAVGVLEQEALDRDFQLPALAPLAGAIASGSFGGGFDSPEDALDAMRMYVGFTESATGAPTESEHTQAETTNTTAGASPVDERGVPFNAEFCSKAASPFYGSGKKKGQWKKRQGVEASKYDYWYDEELAKLAAGTPTQEQSTETTSDRDLAANAFGNQQAATDGAAPQDAGQLMKWVSEQQAAGNITQQQVTDAYTALQLPFDAVMNPAYPVAQNCAAIYNHLKGQI